MAKPKAPVQATKKPSPLETRDTGKVRIGGTVERFKDEAR